MRGFLATIFVLFTLAPAAKADQETADLFAPFVAPEAGLLAWSDLDAEQQFFLLTVEDPDFWNHDGTDSKSLGAGNTTITQAIVKRLYFENFTKGVLNKLRQTRIAKQRVHPNVAKETQLNAFLNIAYLGEGEGGALIGFEAGAMHYFGKSVADLETREFVALVAALIGPNKWTPGTEESEERLRRIGRLVSGDCLPKNNGDVYLEGCR